MAALAVARRASAAARVPSDGARQARHLAAGRHVPSTPGPTATPSRGPRGRATTPAVARTSTRTPAPACSAGRARRPKPLVYVPDQQANTVQVIDPRHVQGRRARFRVPARPQHVVPVLGPDARCGSTATPGNALTPDRPATGQAGRPVAVADPYNLYFTPDGRHALVMAERLQRIDVRDPHTMELQRSLPVPCRGVNHADFTADLTTSSSAASSAASSLVVPTRGHRVEKVIDLNAIKTPGATAR